MINSVQKDESMQILKRVFILSLLVMFFIPITKNQTSSSEHIHFPVVDLRFYEQPHEGVPYFDRVYANYFPADTTRQIAYEINFENPAPGRIVQIPITIKCHRSDGALVEEKHTTLTLQPEWTKWWHSGVLAISEAGNWKPDTYTVSIYDQGREIAGGQFTITQHRIPSETERRNAQKLFNWVEILIPELFVPATPPMEELNGILYRYYANTKTYLALYEGSFFFLYFDDTLTLQGLELGSADYWLAIVEESDPAIPVIRIAETYDGAFIDYPERSFDPSILSAELMVTGNPAGQSEDGVMVVSRQYSLTLSGPSHFQENLFVGLPVEPAFIDDYSENDLITIEYFDEQEGEWLSAGVMSYYNPYEHLIYFEFPPAMAASQFRYSDALKKSSPAFLKTTQSSTVRLRVLRIFKLWSIVLSNSR